MPTFKFRAQVALDLRRRRDEDAQRELAAANAAVLAAEADVRAADDAHEAACREAADVQRRTADVTAIVWHRNWIAACQRETDRRRQRLDERRTEADVAREKATRTHMDVKVLEKFKDRAWRAHVQAEQRAEQKAIDWLAVLKASAAPRDHEDRA